jgi:hypothetical protein
MKICRTIAYAALAGMVLAPVAAHADDDDDAPKVTRSSKNLPETKCVLKCNTQSFK